MWVRLWLNARYLEKLGYGLLADELTSDILERFLLQVPFFEGKLASYAQEGNTLLLAKLDGFLEQISSGRGQAPEALED